MKLYEKTHPWITFRIDLREVPYSFWMKLGECTSKIEHISRVPLVHDSADDLYKIYLAKGVQATTAIEGNTLSEEQVRQHIEGVLELPPSQEYLAQEVDNILKAINTIIAETQEKTVKPLDRVWIKNVNQAVLDHLDQQEGSIPGAIRTHSVLVGGRYRGAPAEDCEYLLDRLCQWLNEGIAVPEGEGIPFAIIKAVIAHLYIAWIHPFGDGNGRTARLLELAILLRSGIPVPACHLLSSHYNATRTEYARQLARASQSGGEVVPFLCYAVQGLLDGLSGQLDMIWRQHLDIVWQHYVYRNFPRQDTDSGERRRNLVLDLSVSDRAVPFFELVSISERVAQSYAVRAPQTIIRDLRWLIENRWIIKEGDHYSANKYSMLSFTPFRASGH